MGSAAVRPCYWHASEDTFCCPNCAITGEKALNPGPVGYQKAGRELSSSQVVASCPQDLSGLSSLSPEYDRQPVKPASLR